MTIANLSLFNPSEQVSVMFMLGITLFLILWAINRANGLLKEILAEGKRGTKSVDGLDRTLWSLRDDVQKGVSVSEDIVENHKRAIGEIERIITFELKHMQRTITDALKERQTDNARKLTEVNNTLTAGFLVLQNRDSQMDGTINDAFSKLHDTNKSMLSSMQTTLEDHRDRLESVLNEISGKLP